MVIVEQCIYGHYRKTADVTFCRTQSWTDTMCLVVMCISGYVIEIFEKPMTEPGLYTAINRHFAWAE